MGRMSFFLNFSLTNFLTQYKITIEITETISVPTFVLWICLPIPIRFFFSNKINELFIIHQKKKVYYENQLKLTSINSNGIFSSLIEMPSSVSIWLTTIMMEELIVNELRTLFEKYLVNTPPFKMDINILIRLILQLCDETLLQKLNQFKTLKSTYMNDSG